MIETDSRSPWFWQHELLPQPIKDEYIRRWNLVDKISERNFIDAVYKDKDLFVYYNSMEEIEEAYQEYVRGMFSIQYPKLPKSPHELIHEVVDSAIVTFKDK